VLSRTWMLLAAAAPMIFAAAEDGIRDLVALPDGQTVYFRIRRGIETDAWYKARHVPGATWAELTPATPNLVDVNNSGTIAATSFFGERRCGFAGSTCFVQPGCRVSAGVEELESGNRRSATNSRETMIRLDRTGYLAWIEQARRCFGIGVPLQQEMRGLYDVRTMTPVSPVGYSLANTNLGRRSITGLNKALVRYSESGLGWWSTNGVLEQIGNRYQPAEAVTDEQGCHIGYSTASDQRQVIWIDWCETHSKTEDLLGFSATSLAMSDNGRYLAGIETAGSRLIVYDHVRRSWSNALIAEPVSRIVIGGRALFAVTSQNNSLVRMDLDTGVTSEMLPPLPEITDARTDKMFSLACPLVCYGPVDSAILASPGMAIFVTGRNLHHPGWLVDQRGVIQTLNSSTADGTSAWFLYQPIDNQSGSSNTIRIFHPALPNFAIQLPLTTSSETFACLGATHESQPDRWITNEDPANVGEIIKVWITGLGEYATPPPLADPDAAAVVSFDPTPNQPGVQLLSLRVQRPFMAAIGDFLFADYRGYQCTPPPVRVP
jgi:hypothetical protein